MATAIRSLFVIAAAFALAGCVKPMSAERIAASAPEFLPERYFAGKATGLGVIRMPNGAPSETIRVESSGTLLPDGSFRLDQTIQQGNGKTSQRHWIMRALGDGRYTATLSDAAGPVTARARGNSFHLRYLMKKPFVTMEQWLWLQPDGRTVLNEGTIRMPGRTIARLSEVIVKE
jgi:hypothetical protein